ncbi:ABC transporter permease subunit [Paeniglutamicibacter sp. ZC-3]|uniref:ABC transporter permease subunit n=1 Tax=Paeniglutamicibacter sp. ZC-3 TaxID=2986919 RepID=UPI0021F7233E|nr:ABC transporter permease subunit [Paeniglutamicibacter sp. ZC-3]MCV9992954.1 ABC transporter permease subunit [Paeniglutamicibacter sp. ZC-3]
MSAIQGTPPAAIRGGRGRRAAAFDATKLASLRSTWIILSLALLGQVGLAWLLGASAQASGENGYDTTMPAPFVAFVSLQLSQLFVAVLAALSVTSEYGSGTITTSLQAVPVRLRFLGSKAAVLGAGGFVSGAVLVGVGTLVAAPAAGSYGEFTPGQLATAMLGAGTYLGLLAMMMVGLGSVLRSSAGAVTAAFVLLFGLPQILPLFAAEAVQEAASYLPTNAAAVLGTAAEQPYGPVTAVAVLAAWTTVFLGAGYAALRGRDS